MHKLTLIGALAALTACNLQSVRPGSQIGSETGGCEIVSEEAITDTSAAPEGFDFAADEVLLALGAFGGDLERTDGEVLDLSFSLSQDGEPSVRRMDLPADAMIEMACGDLIAVPAQLSLGAGDALQETLAVTVLADQGGLISFIAQVDADSLQGSAAPDNLDLSEMAEGWFVVFGDYEGGWTGELAFGGEGFPEGSGDEAAVTAYNDPWGDFSVEAAD